MASEGLFLALDGLDGCGKSTQCRLLSDWLRSQGRQVIACRDPGGTDVGDQLRQLLLHRRQDVTLAAEALLFMASRAQLVAEVIRPALATGAVVVSDRFTLANVVYQGHAGGLPVETLWQVGHLATGGLRPRLTFVLDLPIEAALARRAGPADRIESRDGAYHERVRAGFLSEARRQPELYRLVDALPAAAEVHAVIRKEVERVLAAHQGS